MRLTLPDLELFNDEGFTKEKDIFNRKSFGDRLSNIIANSNENLVLALDAQWGEGKSTFIKMWTNENKFHRDHKLETIYFDAFENDYQKEPFLALASEIYELLENKEDTKKEEFITKAADVAKTFSRGLIRTGVKLGTTGLIDDTMMDAAEKDISKLVSDQVDSVIASKFESSKKDKLALQEFKKFLSEFATKRTDGKRLVFVIDELDRCRPDFALDLLEKIKHLFSVPGVTFLLVMNREQLEESVKCRYGKGIDSSTYLQKFINVWLSLPRRADKQIIDDGKNFLNHSLKLMSQGNKIKNQGTIETMQRLVEHLKPSFRDIERILTYFALIENSREKAMNEYLQDIMAVVCYLKVINPRLLEALINQEAGSEELLSFMKLESKFEKDSYYYELLAKWIEFDLASPEERTRMNKANEVNLQTSERGIRFFYNELTNMQPYR